MQTQQELAAELKRAWQLHEQKQFADAELIYRRLLAVNPRQPLVLFLLGRLELECGRAEMACEHLTAAVQGDASKAVYHATLARAQQATGFINAAVESYRVAIDLEPGAADYHANLGNALLARKDATEAMSCYRKAIELDPQLAAAHTSLGALHEHLGQLAEAEAAHRRALAIDPDYAVAHYNLGLVLWKQQRLEEALACFQEAVRIRPDWDEALANLGAAQLRLGRDTDARRHVERAVQLNPHGADYLNNLAYAQQKQGQIAEAIDSYRRSLELNPHDARVHSNLAILLAASDSAQAEVHYRRAMELDPAYVEAGNNLAALLTEQGRNGEAVEICRQALERAPAFAPAWCNLARALERLGRLDEAIDAARRAVDIDGRLSAGWCNLGVRYKDRGQIDQAIEAHRAGIAADPQDYRHHSNLLYALNYSPDYDPQTVFEAHRDWGRRHADPLTASAPPPVLDRTPDRRLRIGYVSGHFRAHAVAVFTEPMLAAHDHREFEIFCYSNTRPLDAVTRRFQASADQWRDITALDDQAAADLVRADRIDILVDLAGHIDGNRLLVFARRPAPIQVTYLGYQNTTGMAAMDYRLTDEHADPPGKTDAYYTEKLARLPRCFYCYLPDRQAPQPGPLPADARGHVTFGSFNHFAKVTPQVLATWAQLLAAVPDARLVLLAYDTPWLRDHVSQIFAAGGVDPARVELTVRRPHRDYLQLITSVDIALDAFPFNGHTTTCDCLWQGVPVVMMLGTTYAQRFGSTALVHVQLADLIASTPADYVRIASELARDKDRLAGLRGSLRTTMLDSPLLDAAGFTGRLEATYRDMWTRACRQP